MAFVYKKFTAQDYATIPFNANKQYTFLSSASAASNKIDYFHTRYTSESNKRTKYTKHTSRTTPKNNKRLR